jgi:hypothetical protein
MDIEPEASGFLHVYDYNNQVGKLLQIIEIINGTLPAGITSTYHGIYIEFYYTLPPNNKCPTLFDCVKFTLVLDSYCDGEL